MSSYSEGKKTEILLLEGESPELLLNKKAEQTCIAEGIDYRRLEPIQRLFLTHYRCPMCKLVPLYYANLNSPKRVRCGKCGNLIAFTSAGKYGKMRKKIAYLLWMSLEERNSVSQ